jgi:hypothetical protein
MAGEIDFILFIKRTFILHDMRVTFHQSDDYIRRGCTMNQAESIKLRAQSMTLKNLIELYKLCRSARHQLYICSRKTMCKIKDLIELEMFRMANRENECLIVIEGKMAQELVKKAQSILSDAQVQ